MDSKVLAYNSCIMSDDTQELIVKAKILVVGAGGLGGFVAQGLVRLGGQDITVADGDIFSDTNLNRQFFCTAESVNQPKAVFSVQNMLKVYPQGNFKAINAYITEKNISSIINDCDFVFDCSDNIKTKLMLEAHCIQSGIVLIHAGINGHYGQVAIIDGKPLLSSLFSRETKCRNAVILPQIAAGLQLNLFVQYLSKTHAANKLYLIDLHSMQISDINY